MSTRLIRRIVTVVAAASTAIIVSTSSAFAAVDFSGKTVTILVPYAEGGGADVYARLFQGYLNKYLPGNPTVIVRNQPGGGGVKGTNKFDESAKPDGLTLLSMSTSGLVAYVIGGDKVTFKLLEMRPVLLSPRGAIFYVNPKTGVKGKDIVADIKALQNTKLTYGSKNPTSSEMRGALAFEMLGIKDVNVVFGLSSGQQQKAFLRGELNINYDTAGTYSRKLSKYEKEGKLIPVFSMGYGAADGSIVRDPAYPEMPTITEGYTKLNGKAPSGPAAAAYNAYLHMGVTASKSFILPKGTPDEIVDVWVEAVKKVVADKGFRKVAAKVVGAYQQSYGKDAANVLRMATDVSPETKAWLKAWIKRRFDHDI